MFQAKKCTLIKTDTIIKEIVSILGEQENFLIDEINDNSVLVTNAAAVAIEERVEDFLKSKK